MDILAHGLWTAAAARGLNGSRKDGSTRPRIPLWQAVFLGVMPDVLAFTPIFTWLAWGALTGHPHFNEVPRHDATSGASGPFIIQLTHLLYDLGHSLVTWAVAVLLVWLVLRSMGKSLGPVWAMGGWLLHVLIDMATHTATFYYYATPFLWPLSNYRSPGLINWDATWFLALNYLAIICVYVWLYRRDKKI